jgi:hypothetical protein
MKVGVLKIRKSIVKHKIRSFYIEGPTRGLIHDWLHRGVPLIEILIGVNSVFLFD